MNWDIASSCALVAWFLLLAAGEMWLHDGQSRFTGDARLVTNFALGAIALGAGSLLPLARVGTSVAAQQLHEGLVPRAGLSWLAAFLVTLLGLTLVAYWTHRLMHAIPLLWRVHRVHHSDSSVDVSTGLRHHPLEMLLSIPTDALVIILLGAPFTAVIASQTFLMTTALLGHADIRLPHGLDRLLKWVIVTPRLHRLHHHPDRRVHDSNYGDAFTFWDRLFGTLTDLPERLPVGLDKQPGRPDYFFDQIVSPLRID